MNDKSIHHYNEIVDYLERADTLCKEDAKWFAIGYLYCLSMIQGIINANERSDILTELIINNVI